MFVTEWGIYLLNKVSSFHATRNFHKDPFWRVCSSTLTHEHQEAWFSRVFSICQLNVPIVSGNGCYTFRPLTLSQRFHAPDPIRTWLQWRWEPSNPLALCIVQLGLPWSAQDGKAHFHLSRLSWCCSSVLLHDAIEFIYFNLKLKVTYH